jgi:quinol monooxygenase YgiN
MILELMSISVPPGKIEDFGRSFLSFSGPIQVQKGCLSCRVFQGWANEDTLHIEARWESQEDLVRHLRSDVYKKLLLLLELGTAEPNLEFFSVVECRGLDLVQAARISMH